MVLVADKLIAIIVLTDLIVMLIHFLHTGQERATLPGTEESMTTTIEFITALFCQVDDRLSGLPKHPEAHLWPSEVVTLGLLHALKGGGNRPFYRWLTRDYRALLPLSAWGIIIAPATTPRCHCCALGTARVLKL